MEETFYTPPIPRARGTTLRSSGSYQFRQPQTQMNPLALRRLQLQDTLSQRREEEAAGRQELEAMRETARLEQQEYKIRTEITQQKQVASAQREVAKLDPEKDPQWREKYANVMADHPYAQNDKFLTENFLQLGRVNQRVLEAGYRDIEEGQKQTGRMALAKEKEKGAFNSVAAHAAAMGVDASHYHNPETGEMDWGGYTDALTKAKDSFKTAAEQTATGAGLPVKRIVQQEGKPPTVTYEAPKPVSDVPAEIRNAHAKASVAVEALDTRAKETQRYLDAEKDPTKQTALKESLAKINTDRETAAITKAAHEKEFPGLVAPTPPPTTAPPAATPTPTPTPASDTTKPDAPPVSKDRWHSEWDRLTGVMASARAKADIHHAGVNDALDKMGSIDELDIVNPMSGKVDETVSNLHASNAGVDQYERQYSDAMQQRGALLSQKFTPSPDVPTPSASAPTQPAIDYLKANPHFATHFDAKYGENASSEFLTE